MMRRAEISLGIGGSITGAVLLVALLSRFWLPADPLRLRIPQRLQAPFGGAGGLGTDAMGRDLAAQLMVGAWNSLSVAATAVAIGLVLGAALGLLAALKRGWIELLVLRLTDLLFAFPAILSAFVLAALLGGGAGTAILAIGLFNVPVFARVTRAAALGILTQDYIRAARLSGKTGLRLAWDHLLPMLAGGLIVQATIQIALAILTEAGLSFLGVGITPPNPSWGRMLADAQTYLARAPHLALLPGGAIALSVLGFNLLGDGLRDRLDPKGRR